MANQDRLLQVLAEVELNEAHWDPRFWAFRPDGNECGTTYCTAGHAIKLVHPDAVFEFGNRMARYVSGNVRGSYTNSVVMPDGKRRHVETIATELLGLTADQADRLFYYGVSVRDLDEDGDVVSQRDWDLKRDGVPTVDGLRELIKGIIDEDQEAREACER